MDKVDGLAGLGGQVGAVLAAGPGLELVQLPGDRPGDEDHQWSVVRTVTVKEHPADPGQVRDEHVRVHHHVDQVLEGLASPEKM